MQFNEVFLFACAPVPLWRLLMDVREVADCMEGVGDLTLVDDDTFHGTLRVTMGPIGFAFGGEVRVVAREHATFTAALTAHALDRKAGGGFQCELTMRIVQLAAAQSELDILLTTDFLGRVGQLGRPLIKKKIATMLNDFAQQVQARCAPSAVAVLATAVAGTP